MSETRVASPASPYKGLAAFEDSDLDALLFFGRARDTEIIAANVMASRFTVLYGPLGVGKSSVLRAGVMRRLRSLAPEALVVAHGSWAGDAVAALLCRIADTLHVECPPPDASLADGLAELAGHAGGELYLLLDQFEEVFVYPGAAALAASLAEVVTRPDLPVDILLALREDALAELDVFTGRIPNVFGNYLPLDRLDRLAAHAAITGPIARYNELADRSVAIEGALVDAVLDQVEAGRVRRLDPGDGGEPGARGVEAPYLQLVMERLWNAERRRGSSVLRRATLDELGGAEAIVRAHLGEAVGALAPDDRDVAARIFNHLVTPSGTKIAHGAGDLAEYAGVGDEELRRVLASLGGSRIVRPVDGRFEIFHDVLADAVLTWRARHESERALERQRAEAERRHGRLIALLAMSLVALAAVAAVAIYALAQRSAAREQSRLARAQATSAKASELAAQAGLLIPISALEADPQLGLLLAVEAARLSPTTRTAGVLRRALLLSQLRAVLPEGDVTSAAFSPNGTRIALGGASHGVRIYAGDGRRRLMQLGPDRPGTGAAFSPDGRLVLTTERRGPARIWDAQTGTQLHALGRAPSAASFSADGALVLTVERDAARVWRTADASAVAALRSPAPVRRASFTPRGERVVTLDGGRVARVFDARTARLVAAVDHGDAITSVTPTPDARGLVTTSAQRAPRVWTLRRGGRLLRALPAGAGTVTAAAVAPDGRLLVTASTDGVARVWELPSARLVADLVGHTNRVTGAAFSRDGSSIVTWSPDRTALVWDVARGSARVALAGHGDAVTGAAFDITGEAVLTTGADGRARLWRSRVRTGLDPVADVPTPVAAAAFSDDGSTAAVAGASGIRIVRAADGEEIARLPPGGRRGLALSRDGALVAASAGRRVSVWQVESGEPAGTFDAGGTATALAVGPGAGRLAVGTARGAIGVWAPGAPGRTVLVARGPRATSLALDASGGRVAAGFADGAIAAWSIGDRRTLFRSRPRTRGAEVRSIAFSADGGRLVTAGDDSIVRVWDAATGAASYALRGHYGRVSDAAFSTDGRWAVTAGPTAAGLWDLESRERFLFLQGHAGRVLAAAFDAPGRRVVTVGRDGTLRAYRCEVCVGVPELLRLARRAAAGRRLTGAERRRYLARG